MRRIIYIILLLVPIALAIQTHGVRKMPEKRQREGKVESALCGYRVSGLNFKCNLEYQKIDMKFEMEKNKAKSVCANLLELRNEKCRNSEDEHCNTVNARLGKWCRARVEEIEQFRLKSRKVVQDACSKAAEEFQGSCPNNVFKIPGKEARARVVHSITLQRPPQLAAVPLRKPITPKQKSKTEQLIDFVYGETQQNLNKQDLTAFAEHLLKNNHSQPIDPTKTEALVNFVFGQHQNKVTGHDISAFLQHIYEPSKPVKPKLLIHESWKYGGPLSREYQIIIEFIFRGVQYQLPKPAVVAFVHHLLDDDPRKLRPITKKPVPKPKINPDMEATVDYIFERLKYKIDKYYQDNGKMNVPSIVSYLLGRYKQHSEKHKIGESASRNNQNTVNVQQILSELTDESKSKPNSNIIQHIIPILESTPAVDKENKLDISFIYKVIDELVSQAAADRQPIGKPQSIVKDKNGKIRINRLKPIQYSVPVGGDLEDNEDEETDNEKPDPVEIETLEPNKSNSTKSPVVQPLIDIDIILGNDTSTTLNETVGNNTSITNTSTPTSGKSTIEHTGSTIQAAESTAQVIEGTTIQVSLGTTQSGSTAKPNEASSKAATVSPGSTEVSSKGSTVGTQAAATPATQAATTPAPQISTTPEPAVGTTP